MVEEILNKFKQYLMYNPNILEIFVNDLENHNDLSYNKDKTLIAFSKYRKGFINTLHNENIDKPYIIKDYIVLDLRDKEKLVYEKIVTCKFPKHNIPRFSKRIRISCSNENIEYVEHNNYPFFPFLNAKVGNKVVDITLTEHRKNNVLVNKKETYHEDIYDPNSPKNNHEYRKHNIKYELLDSNEVLKTESYNGRYFNENSNYTTTKIFNTSDIAECTKINTDNLQPNLYIYKR